MTELRWQRRTPNAEHPTPNCCVIDRRRIVALAAGQWDLGYGAEASRPEASNCKFRPTND